MSGLERRQKERQRYKRECDFVRGRLNMVRDRVVEHYSTEKGRAILQKEALLQKQLRLRHNAHLSCLPKDQAERQRLLYCFQTYDVDGTGYIDLTEFQLMAKELCVPTTDSSGGDCTPEIFAQMDVDASGEIDFDEFAKWYEGFQLAADPALRKVERQMAAAKAMRDESGETDMQNARRCLVTDVVKRTRAKLQEGFRQLQPPVWQLSEEEQHAIEHNLPLPPLLPEDFVPDESLLRCLGSLDSRLMASQASQASQPKSQQRAEGKANAATPLAHAKQMHGARWGKMSAGEKKEAMLTALHQVTEHPSANTSLGDALAAAHVRPPAIAGAARGASHQHAGKGSRELNGVDQA